MRIRGGVLLGSLLIGDFNEPVTDIVVRVLFKTKVNFARVFGTELYFGLGKGVGHD